MRPHNLSSLRVNESSSENYLRSQFSLVRSPGEHQAINLYTRFVRARKREEKMLHTGEG